MADLQQTGESEDRPLIELFVKAGVDHMKNGGCPMCHRYFLLFYILREHGLIDLVVTTFRPHDLPPEVKSFSSAKQFPLVKVHRGVDANGVSLIDTTCDTVPEIEDLLDRFDCEDCLSVKESAKEAQAEKVFQDLYRKFKAFLNDQINEQPIVQILEKIDAHLKENGTKFLLKDGLTRADCYLLPTLQHLRVAGKFFKDFEIPTEYECLWRYLENAYNTEGMHQSTPADREIIRHYEGKTASRKKQTHASLMKDARTFSVPSAAAHTQPQQANGAAGDRTSSGSEHEHAQNDYGRQMSDEVSHEPAVEAADNGDVTPATPPPAMETAGSSDAEDAPAAAAAAQHDDDSAPAADYDDVAAVVADAAARRDSDDATAAPSDPIHNGD